ncbi:MAG: glycosyltransferase family 39 protein [Armatimonadota bacterium]|nr:glycosyltransferase family 39 protein [Armatimonadota bacterium]
MSPRLARALEALSVFAAVVMVLAGTAHSYGLGYDEPVYMSRMQEAGDWLRLLSLDPGQAVSDAGIRPFWDARSEQQPGFLKLWGALTTPLVAGVLPTLAALRFGTHLLVGALCASLYLLVSPLWGRLEGVAAVGALLTLPRTFAHSHLFALDAPVMAGSFISLHMFYLAARDRSWWWAAAGSLVWGMALSIKINAFFVPLIVVPWLALYARDALLPAVACGATLGPLAFLGTWPWLWHHTLARLGEYLAFHFRHWQIHVTYFGRRMAPAPWHYPVVMTLITTPVVTLAAAVAGAVRMAREPVAEMAEGRRERWSDEGYRRRAAGALIGWALAVNFIMNSLPSTPKYTGVRLFQPVFPLLAFAAGIGIGWAARAVGRWLAQRAPGQSLLRRAGPALVVVLALALPLRSTVACHPWQMSYYNLLIGGLPGAERAGMEVTHWGETYLDAALWLNEHAPAGATAWIEPPGVEATMGVYRALGILRADIETTAGPFIPAEADYAVFQNKVTEFTDVSRHLLATQPPRATIDVHGVPLLFIFDVSEEGKIP